MRRATVTMPASVRVREPDRGVVGHVRAGLVVAHVAAVVELTRPQPGGGARPHRVGDRRVRRASSRAGGRRRRGSPRRRSRPATARAASRAPNRSTSAWTSATTRASDARASRSWRAPTITSHARGREPVHGVGVVGGERLLGSLAHGGDATDRDAVVDHRRDDHPEDAHVVELLVELAREPGAEQLLGNVGDEQLVALEHRAHDGTLVGRPHPHRRGDRAGEDREALGVGLEARRDLDAVPRLGQHARRRRGRRSTPRSGGSGARRPARRRASDRRRSSSSSASRSSPRRGSSSRCGVPRARRWARSRSIAASETS